MNDQHNEADEDMASDAEIAAMMQALANGERAHFYGAGEEKGVGEPRLILWQDGNLFRIQGRGGVDFGAFGSIRVAWRFMAKILMEEQGEDG